MESEDSEVCNNQPSCLVCSEEELLLPGVPRLSWLGCVQKEAKALIQAKINAEVEKRTLGLTVLPPPSLATQKPKTTKTADVAGPRCRGFAGVRSVEGGEAPEA